MRHMVGKAGTCDTGRRITLSLCHRLGKFPVRSLPGDGMQLFGCLLLDLSLDDASLLREDEV